MANENMENSEPGLEPAEKNRHTSYKKTQDMETIIRVINEKFLKKKLTIQLATLSPKYAHIISFDDTGMIIQFDNFVPPVGGLLLSGFINDFYTELGIEVINNKEGNLFLCKPKLLRIASQKRMDERFVIDNADLIYVNKIRIAKADLDFSGKNLPVSYKILLQQFQQENHDLGDKVQIASFGDVKEDIYNKVFKTGKTFYISNIDDNENYQQNLDNDEFLSLEEAGSNWEKMSKELSNHNRKGWLISPILTDNADGAWIPLGFVEIVNNTPITTDTLMTIKALSFKILDKIKSMNLMEVKERQKVIDVSRTGIRLEVENQKLIDAILRRREMIFDIIMKMQAPITIQGWIRATKILDNGKLHVGLKIQGENNRQNQMKRYIHFINELSQKARQTGKD